MIFNNIYMRIFSLSYLINCGVSARTLERSTRRGQVILTHRPMQTWAAKFLQRTHLVFVSLANAHQKVFAVSVSSCRLFSEQRVRLSKTVWQAVQKCWFILQYCLWIAGAALIASSSAKVRRAAALPPNAFKKGRATKHAEILVKQSKYLSP